MNALPLAALTQMTRRLTTPFGRGADTLALALVADGSATQSRVADYDFAEHRALYGQLPAPRYLLTLQRDLAVTTTVRIDYVARPGAPAQPPVTLTIAAGTLAGTSFLLALGANEGPTARLTKVTMSPAATNGEVASWWRLTALLGNLAKLFWVLGWERDQIRRQLARTTAQRQLPNALGLSLDLIGYDLGIPRFPPLPYSFDEATIALYHLNDLPGALPAVADIIGRYPGQTGHPGTVVGNVTPGTPARFGNGFALLTPNATVEIPDHSDFALAATQSFTAECFVQPLRGAGEGHLLSKHPDPATTQAGWVLSIGDFGRGLGRNLRWLLSDGVNPPLVLFADLSLATDRFTHLAGVIDRQRALALLYIDGQLVAQTALGPLKALTSSVPVRIGHPTAAATGVIEEVRLSRVARATFHPVLGESDASYRQRLRFFRRWLLPTPSNLLALLNEAIGPINGDLAPLIVNELNTTIIGGVQPVTVLPATLLPGESMDGAGNRRVTESVVSGRPRDEHNFDPIFLLVHNDSRVIYAPADARVLAPNEPPADTHKVQLVVERALNRLLDLAALEGGGGKLIIHSAFDPRATDLCATGRALLFKHTTIGLGRLAALAQRAGFDFVCHRSDLGLIYASCAQGDYVELVATTPPAFTGQDGQVGETLTLTVRPALPGDTTYRWLTIACGAGDGRFIGSRTAPQSQIQLSTPGGLTVKVDVIRRRKTVGATRTLQIGLKELSANQTIGSDGTLGVTEQIAGAPDRFFHPALLVNHNDARATYGTDPNHHLMQFTVAVPLNRLLDLLAAGGVSGKLQVAGAFSPGATDLTGVGRGLTLRHPNLPPGQLAALAFAAGFTFVQRQDPTVIIRQAAADLVPLNGPQQVEEGQKITLVANLKASDISPAVRLQWTVSAAGQAQARLSSTTQPTVTLQGIAAGQVRVAARYLIGDNPAPYTVEVRLNPTLEAANAIIRKEQYDLVMNLLNTFHPIGVEVITRALRAHVVELQGNVLEANPDYTYPKFRVRGPAPRR